MADSEQKASVWCFKLAGVCAIVLVSVPLASLILSALIEIVWPAIGVLCIFAGAGIVIFAALGGIVAIFEE